jgi:predicted DNA-binding transcriptional regulator YafY
MRFEEVYGTWGKRNITQEEAARMLGVSDRTFRRYVDRYEREPTPMLGMMLHQDGSDHEWVEGKRSIIARNIIFFM